LRQIPNGLTPNFIHGLAVWMRSFISCMNRSMLLRRQSALVAKPVPYWAKVASSPKSCPAAGYG
jgi:hypothetical protein